MGCRLPWLVVFRHRCLISGSERPLPRHNIEVMLVPDGLLLLLLLLLLLVLLFGMGFHGVERQAPALLLLHWCSCPRELAGLRQLKLLFAEFVCLVELVT